MNKPSTAAPIVNSQQSALHSKGFAVISCYEAGSTGYWLHRKLTTLWVTNYVVCPTRLDSRGKGVNTDKTDALDLYIQGQGRTLDCWLTLTKSILAHPKA